MNKLLSKKSGMNVLDQDLVQWLTMNYQHMTKYTCEKS